MVRAVVLEDLEDVEGEMVAVAPLQVKDLEVVCQTLHLEP